VTIHALISYRGKWIASLGDVQLVYSVNRQKASGDGSRWVLGNTCQAWFDEVDGRGRNVGVVENMALQ
jgi:hypothetical protein